MSIHCTLEPHELAGFLRGYALGEPLAHRPLYPGAYRVTTGDGAFVLVLSECRDALALPELLAHLAGAGIPVGHPQADRAGRFLGTLRDKPALLLSGLEGEPVAQPNAAQCRALGEALGRLHRAGESFPTGPRDQGGWRATAQRLLPMLAPEETRLLRDELRFQSLFRFADLPRGIIHGGPTRDRVWFVGDRLGGLLGLERACHDVLLYDLAVATNAWCTDMAGALAPALSAALLGGYRQQRPLRAIERGAWPVLLRQAALRAWLAELRARHLPEGAVRITGDADVGKRLLCRRIAQQDRLAAGWE